MLDTDRLVVVGDIGGTHMRFAVADCDELSIDHYVQFRCSEFTSLQQGLSAYLKSLPNYPRKISLAVAGPVVGEKVRMSNLPWVVEKKTIQSVSATDDVVIVNDFEALALALPFLDHHDLCQIGPGAIPEGANKALVGPGTGLGVAGAARCGTGWTAMSGEGGHMTFAAQSKGEFTIFDKLRYSRHHVSWEHLLSGPGMINVYEVLNAAAGNAAKPEMTAEDIVASARNKKDEIATQVLDWFVTWLGRFAGDVALVFGARGGLYLGGGISPRILNELQRGAFRVAFENKGRLSPYLKEIPLFVIKAADAGLRGAAVAYSNRAKS